MDRRQLRLRSALGAVGLAFLFVLFLLTPVGAAPARHVDVLDATGTINPVFATYVERGISRAEEDGATALVVEIDTPGGLDTSMREIVQAFEASTVPVVVYVSPSGGRAASAGLFVTEAAPIAAMAPDTNVGSAHPVGLSPSGGTAQMDPVEEAKVTNDAVALIRNLATTHHRNADWVEQAVRQSLNVGTSQALELHVVDLQARDVPDLLRQIDGRAVTLASGPVVLHTADAEIDPYPMTTIDQAWQALGDPTLAYILMTLGVYALIYEVTHPGAVAPGVFGVLALVVGLFALGSLPVSLAGLALVVFGFALLIAEVLVVPGSGVLAAGGLGSLVLGSLLLWNDSAPGAQVAPWALFTVVGASAAFFIILSRAVLSARRRRPRTGREGMIGATATALTDLNPGGQVLVHGEIWRAMVAPGFVSIPRGERVLVLTMEGLRLTVAPEAVEAGVSPRALPRSKS